MCFLILTFNFFLIAGVSDNPWNLFEEIGILGNGTFAVVLKVRSRIDGKEYAIKQTYRLPILKEVKHCKREIEDNSELVNTHVARHFKTFRDTSGRIYIQMELCGEDLEKYLEENELIESNIRNTFEAFKYFRTNYPSKSICENWRFWSGFF